jgi:hypothetical protein
MVPRSVAFAHPRATIALEDDLPYDEPRSRMQPTHHAPGALLPEQGMRRRPKPCIERILVSAVRLPRARIHPDNVWTLRRLLDCFQRRGEAAESTLIRQRAGLAAARAALCRLPASAPANLNNQTKGARENYALVAAKLVNLGKDSSNCRNSGSSVAQSPPSGIAQGPATHLCDHVRVDDGNKHHS